MYNWTVRSERLVSSQLASVKFAEWLIMKTLWPGCSHVARWPPQQGHSVKVKKKIYCSCVLCYPLNPSLNTWMTNSTFSTLWLALWVTWIQRTQHRPAVTCWGRAGVSSAKLKDWLALSLLVFFQFAQPVCSIAGQLHAAARPAACCYVTRWLTWSTSQPPSPPFF